MRYVVALLLAFTAGLLLAAVAVIANPWSAGSSARAAGESLLLTHAGRGPAAIFHVDSGYPWLADHPAGSGGLRAGTVRFAAASALLLNNSGGSPVAIAVRLSALRSDSRPLTGKLLEDNVWHVTVPGRGSFVAMTTDNLWPLITDVALPALRAENDRWQGEHRARTTIGPHDLGHGFVIGLGGAFTGLDGEAVNAITVRDFESGRGPVDMLGELALTFD